MKHLERFSEKKAIGVENMKTPDEVEHVCIRSLCNLKLKGVIEVILCLLLFEPDLCSLLCIFPPLSKRHSGET